MHLGGYCGNKGAMATVTGVTAETTVAMETASQRDIFEASKEKHAPSLISVCVRACVAPPCLYVPFTYLIAYNVISTDDGGIFKDQILPSLSIN